MKELGSVGNGKNQETVVQVPGPKEVSRREAIVGITAFVGLLGFTGRAFLLHEPEHKRKNTGGVEGIIGSIFPQTESLRESVEENNIFPHSSKSPK